MRTVALSSIATVSAGQGAPKPNEFANNGIPFVRAGSLDGLLSGKKEADLELVPIETAKKRKLKLYPKGAILFAKSGMSATMDRIYSLNTPAYVVSHLAILIPKNIVHADYLRLALTHFPPSVLIKDPAYPAISLGEIQDYKIPVPEEIDDQKRIAHLLSKMEGLIAQRKQHLQQLDDLLRSVFLEMFGDPVRNEKGWDKPTLNQFGKISTGNTPPRNAPSNYSSKYIEWIKTDNISAESIVINQAAEYLSETGASKARTVNKGALLVACIAGSVESIGRAALTDRTVTFNQQINAIQPNKDVNPFYLYILFKISKAYIQSHASKGMKKILTKGDFEKITMIKPPVSLQDQFSAIVEKVAIIKSRYQQSLADLESLYGALSQKAFNGELDLSRVPLPPEHEEKTEVDSSAQESSPDPERTLPTFILPQSDSLEVLKTPKSRKEHLQECFNAYLNHLQKSKQEVSLDAFLIAVKLQLESIKEFAEKQMENVDVDDEEELFNWIMEFEPNFSPADYDSIKVWLFQALEQGQLKQHYQDNTNTVQLVATGS